jgi:hypothetical protein
LSANNTLTNTTEVFWEIRSRNQTFLLNFRVKRSTRMSDQAATTNASPPKDENQNKDTPVSIRKP